MENEEGGKEKGEDGSVFERLASTRQRWKLILSAVLVFLIIIFAFVIIPLMDGIVMGLILAYVARPVKKYLDRYIPGSSSLVASLAIIMPIFIILGIGMIEIGTLIVWMTKNYQTVTRELINIAESLNLPEIILAKVKDIILNFTSYIIPLLKQMPLISIAKSIALFFLNIFIAMLACYYLLKDGGGLVEKVLKMTPPNYDRFVRRFVINLDMILSAIFVGNTYSAISVGVISLIVFYIFDIPKAFAMAALMLIAAVVPILAGWMIIVPLTIYKYLEFGTQSALIFLFASIVFIIIPPELVIRPYLIKVQSDIHPLLIIIAFIGGGLIGGIAGFFIVPILLGIIVAAYRTYAGEVEYSLKSKTD